MTDLRSINELKVYRNKVFAGVLRRTSQGCELKFEPEFINNPQFPYLSYKIKKHNLPYTQTGVNLPPYFAGLLPEGLRLKILIKELKTSEDDLFTLLAASGESTAGDVYVQAPGLRKHLSKTVSTQEIDFYEFFESQIKNGFLDSGHETLSGIQEKISTSMINFPFQTKKKNKSYILKLNPQDKSNLIYNEFQCLNLAQKCGFKTNSVRIIYDKNNNPGLLVERFDRIFSKDKTIHRVHQEDACQFLDLYPADKYRISFQEICQGIKEFATAPLIEIAKALQLYIFSYLIGNGDLHAKNISLQTDPKTNRIHLSPTYDLICTYLYGDQTMALKLDGKDTNFKRKNFIDFGLRFGLTKKFMNESLNQLLQRLDEHQELLFQIEGLSKKNITLIKKMLNERKIQLRP